MTTDNLNICQGFPCSLGTYANVLHDLGQDPLRVVIDYDAITYFSRHFQHLAA